MVNLYFLRTITATQTKHTANMIRTYLEWKLDETFTILNWLHQISDISIKLCGKSSLREEFMRFRRYYPRTNFVVLSKGGHNHTLKNKRSYAVIDVLFFLFYLYGDISCK